MRNQVPSNKLPTARCPLLRSWLGTARTGSLWEVAQGDALTTLRQLKSNYFSCVITSPPYYSQRDYGVAGQIGLEASIDEYVRRIVAVFSEVRRVLAADGTLFLNLGDTYYSGKGQPVGADRKNGARRFGLRPVDASGLGVPQKTAIGIPWRVALAMIDDSWILRSSIIWRRTDAVPEPSAHDRPWRTYEHVFLFAKSRKYFFRREGLHREEDIWTIPSRPTHARSIHSAAFPQKLVSKCLRHGCKPNGSVLDPFAGSGTVPIVATKLGHPTLAIDLNPQYARHIASTLGLL